MHSLPPGKKKGIRIHVHGDEYASTAKPEQLQWMKTKLENKYAVTTHVLGPGRGEETNYKSKYPTGLSRGIIPTGSATKRTPDTQK